MQRAISFAGLRLTASWAALPLLIVFCLFLSGLVRYFFALSWSVALATGLLATLFHLISVYWHDLGHAVAARSVGFPMNGIHLHSILATTTYPLNEPALPARIHLQRALGGPIASLILTLIALLLWRRLGDQYGDALSLALAFFCLENLFVFALQIFLPLGFNDGSTILYWLRKR